MEVRKGYKQTDVGVIPEDWEVKPLKQISPLQSVGLVINPSTYFDDNGTVPMLVGSNITENQIDWMSARRITDSSNKLIPSSQLRTNDLVTVRVGDPGTTAVVPPELDGCNCASMMIVRQHKSFNSHWLSYAMNSPIGLGQVKNVQYGTAQKQFNISDAVNFIFPVPPLPEQHAIAAILSDADSLLAALDELIAKKRLIKQGAMRELLTGRKRLPGFTAKWEVKKIGEITRTTAGGTPSTLIDSYWGGEIKWMSSGELHLKRVYDVEGRITEEGLKNSSTSIIPPKCVLIGLAGQGKTRGTVAMNMVELCTNQSIAAILPSNAFIPEYLYFNFDSRYDELRSISTGDGGRGGLNLTLINKMVVPLPPLPEQTAIAEILSDMDAEIASLEARREKTSLLKQGMMQELLTGKIRLV